MALQITLVKAPAAVSMTKTSHLFDRRGGTLGRGEANLWVLPDPEKFLSACHCELLFESSGYFLLDLSTNGTFLNGAFEPIGKGSRLALTHGDFFDVGEYRFSVSLTEDQPFGVSTSSVFSVAPDDGFNKPSVAPIPLNPFDDAGLLPSGFSSGLAESQDPLAAFDKAGKAKGPDIFSNDTPLFGQPVFSPDAQKPYGSPAGYGSQKASDSGLLDVTPNIDQAISWPSSSRQSLIPEDWEDDAGLAGDPFAFGVPEAMPSQHYGPQGIHTPIANDFPTHEQPKPVVDALSNFQSTTRARQPANPVQDIAEDQGMDWQDMDLQIPDPQIANSHGGNRESSSLDTAIVEAAPRQAASSQGASLQSAAFQIPRPHASTHPQVSAHHESGGNDILIRAMGLNPDALSAQEMNNISEKVGVLMREITEGMMQVLRSRTSIKNEFRMNVTTIQPVENNPLKFSVGVDEAMENMFIKKTNAYKKPSEAFREGFQEIGEHQVAMIAGIRHGFEKMMDRFNPENLEVQFNKQVKGLVLPGMQKTRHWTSYKDHYQNYSDNMESSFQHLFGSDFVTAYEDQLRKLIAARKKNKS